MPRYAVLSVPLYVLPSYLLANRFSFFLYQLLLPKAVRYVCLSVLTSLLFVFGALRLILSRDGLPYDGPVHKMSSICVLAMGGSSGGDSEATVGMVLQLGYGFSFHNFSK